ncbi:hypothetical protein Pgin01_02003 [Porphyromonas gingivalis]
MIACSYTVFFECRSRQTFLDLRAVTIDCIGVIASTTFAYSQFSSITATHLLHKEMVFFTGFKYIIIFFRRSLSGNPNLCICLRSSNCKVISSGRYINGCSTIHYHIGRGTRRICIFRNSIFERSEQIGRDTTVRPKSMGITGYNLSILIMVCIQKNLITGSIIPNIVSFKNNLGLTAAKKFGGIAD